MKDPRTSPLFGKHFEERQNFRRSLQSKGSPTHGGVFADPFGSPLDPLTGLPMPAVESARRSSSSFFVCGSPRQLTDHMPNTRNGVLLCFHCCDRSKPPITCRTGCTATVVRKSRVRKGSRTTTPDPSSGRCTCEHHFQESGVPLSNIRLRKHGSP